MLTVRRLLLPALIAALACLQVQCTDRSDSARAETLRQSGTQKYLDGDGDGALEDFSLAIALMPDDARGYYLRGRVGRDPDAQLADYDRAIALDPKFTDAYVYRGIARLRRGEGAKAANDFTRALELNSQSGPAYLGRASARNQQGDLAGALADCDKAIEIDPKNPRAYTNRGAIRLDWQLRRRLKQEEELKLAIQDLTKAIEIEPGHGRAYAERGAARRAMGDMVGALEDGTTAIELTPKLSYAYQARGSTWLDQGEIGKAIGDFTKMVELASPTNTSAWSSRGRAYALQHDWARSLQDHETAWRKDPRDLYPALHRWVMQMHLGRDAAGPLRAALMEAAKLPAPDHTASWRTQGVALETAWLRTVAAHLLGEIDQAALLSAAEQSDAEKTLERKCEAWYFAGCAQLGVGRKEEAARCFQECVDTGMTQYVEYQLAVAELAFMKVGR